MELSSAVTSKGLRPMLPPASACPPGWLDLVQACWQQDPALRPTMQQVEARLGLMLQQLEGWEGVGPGRAVQCGAMEVDEDGGGAGAHGPPAAGCGAAAAAVAGAAAAGGLGGCGAGVRGLQATGPEAACVVITAGAWPC